MKKISIALFSILLALFFLTPTDAKTSQQLSSEEREHLLEEYAKLKERLEYLRWYVQKFEMEKELNAASYLVINNDKGTVLLEKEINHSRPIASITKLMTAVVALENIDVNEKLTLAQEMFLVNSYQRQSPAIFPGTTLLAGDLLRATLIQSTNDAAQCLTHFLTKDDFIKLMNKKAKELNMKETSFQDVHGLSRYNTSSAKDLTKLINYILKNHPEIMEMTREENFQLPGRCPEHNWICTFMNLNTFHGLAEFIGGKTGYTNAAGHTFVGVFDVKKDPHTIVLLNTRSRTNDTQKIANWLRERP